ncbi:MAG: 2-oxoacid:acceptor oxidoreductase subunit alpha [Desulfomonilaceae bacterium]|jgi:2-oxoglutarate ferredoxin oxidoreductase subunit alpha
MSEVDFTVEVCGMAGDGTIAAGGLINEAMSLGGFSVLGFDSYPAEIRGFGRCVTKSRIGSTDIVALGEQTHALISLNDEQSRSRAVFLDDHALVFFDSNPPSYVSEEKSLLSTLSNNVEVFGLPFGDLAVASGAARSKNLVALGGFAAVTGIDPSLFRQVILKKFKAKGDRIVDINIKSFDAGYDYALEKFHDRLKNWFAKSGTQYDSDKVMMSGNQAIGMAAIEAGLKLYFGYPITPATPIMEYLAKWLPEKGGRVVQMEDEISSIGAVLGSFYAGERAMTATSGPGFALMTELITHGVMAEIPAVIIDAQRAGPATGLPTKTEQSDLHAAVFGGPGDSARIVIAPTNVEECYYMVLKSFQLAEKYQTPVIVLTDFFLDNRVENLHTPRASDELRACWNVFPDESPGNRYLRYEDTSSGISPRAIPGMQGYNYTATGLEHTESGSPDYSSEIHTKMTEKRHRKIRNALEDLQQPTEFFSSDQLDVGVIGWGSTFGSVLEAVAKSKKNGFRVGALKITSIFPYHSDIIKAFMAKSGFVLIPELNYEGQLANLLERLNSKPVERLNLVTATPIPPSAIQKRIEELLEVGA